MVNSIQKTGPLIALEEDAFRYKEFARHVATCLKSIKIEEGLVIALCGPWGSGKSTTLSYVVKQLSEGVTQKETPIFITFNPWMCKSEEQIVKDLLLSLKSELGANRFSKASRYLEDTSEVISGTEIPIVSHLAKIVKGASEVSEKRYQHRAEAEKELSKSPRKAIVLIDDIDRLSETSIRLLFAVIRCLCDLPNIVFLLCIDRDVVSRALSQLQETNGQSYLEKIVQVFFDIPLPDHIDLGQKAFEKLQKMMTERGISLIQDVGFWNCFLDGVLPFLSTPRNLTTFINSVTFSYPAVANEVHFGDYLILESLRLFSPKVYSEVASSPSYFCGIADGKEMQSNRKYIRRQISDVWSSREAAALSRLFPKIPFLLSDEPVMHEKQEQWVREKHIASIQCFSSYFKLGMSPEEICFREYEELTKIGRNYRKLLEKISELSEVDRRDGYTHAYSMFEMTCHFSNSIDKALAKNLLTCLFELESKVWKRNESQRIIYERLVTSKPRPKATSAISLLEFNTLAILVEALLRRIDEVDRQTILRDCFTYDNAWRTMKRVIDFLENEHQDHDLLVEIDFIDELRTKMMFAIKAAFVSGSLRGSPLVFEIEQALLDSNGLSLRDWCRSEIETLDGVVSLLKSVHSTAEEKKRAADKVAYAKSSLDLVQLRKFLKRSELLNAVDKFLSSEEVSNDGHYLMAQAKLELLAEGLVNQPDDLIK